MWRIEENDLEAISIGAGILGSGGGGSPYIGKLRAREAIRRHGGINVLTPDELKETDRIVCLGMIGAPTVLIEKLPDLQAYAALRAIEEHTKVKATALIPNEIGGINSLEPLIPAAIAGLPVVDADGMGRAFPELQMKTIFVYGVPSTPLSLCDEKGNIAIFTKAVNTKWVEDMARVVTIQMGCIACYAVAPMDANQVKSTAVLNTLSLAKSLGENVLRARSEKSNIIESILKTCPGKEIFQGKIVDLERRTSAGFALGSVVIDGLDKYLNTKMKIDFQNENLIARIDEDPICTVPDLICIIDSERGEPITTELLRYGFRVTVLAFPAPNLWTTPKGLAVVGPKAFGYDMEFKPLKL